MVDFLKVFVNIFTPSFLISLILKLCIQRYLSSDVEKALESNLERFARVFIDYLISLLYALIIVLVVYLMVSRPEIISTKKNETDTSLIQSVILIFLVWGILFLGCRSVLGISILLPKRTYFIQDGKQLFIEKTIKKNFILLSYNREEHRVSQLFKVISYEQIIGKTLYVETREQIYKNRGKQFYSILKWYKQSWWRVAFFFVCIFVLFCIVCFSFFKSIWTGVVTLLWVLFIVFWYYFHIKYYEKT